MTATRLLVASNMYPGPLGPYYGTFVERHVRAFRGDPRFAVRLVAIDDPRKGKLRSPRKYARFYATLGRELLRRPDVVHYHYALPTAVLGPLHAPLGIPYVVTLHGGDVYDMPGKIPGGTTALQQVLGGARAVICVSHSLQADVQRLVDRPVQVIDMGVDTDRLTPMDDGNPRRLAFVGQLIERKGLDLLITALAARRELTLTVVGDGPQRAQLEAQARATGAAVRFVGAVAPADLRRVLAGCGALVVPSRREPLGVVALEGMALGLVVAAAEVGGLREIVRDGASGVGFAPNDPADLGRALDRLATQAPEARQALRQAGFATAAEHAVSRQVSRVAEVLLAATH